MRFFFTCAPHWLVSASRDIHVIGFGAMCHAPNLIPGFVTMTDMLISSLNLILTRTNLTFWKLLQKLSSFFSLLFLYLNDPFTWHSEHLHCTLKNNIIHQLLKFWISHNTSLNTLRYTLPLDPKIHNTTKLNIKLLI